MLKFSADHHFVIGYNHVLQGKPCQDHALSFADDRSAVAVVSDGCSSGGETDMGARMLTFTLMNTIKGYGKTPPDPLQPNAPRAIAFDQWLALKEAARLVGFSRSDALATCLYAYLHPSGGYAHLRGDGVIAWKERGGTLSLARYDWADNMPFYPAYADDEPHGYDSFIAAHGGSLATDALHEERWVKVSAEASFARSFDADHSVGAGIRGIVLPFTGAELLGMEFVAVFTDGVTQVEGVDWKEVVLRLLDFKTTGGAFAKRRMNRLLAEYRKTENNPLDDIAYSVIVIEHKLENEVKGEEDGNAESSAQGGA